MEHEDFIKRVNNQLQIIGEVVLEYQDEIRKNYGFTQVISTDEEIKFSIENIPDDLRKEILSKIDSKTKLLISL